MNHRNVLKDLSFNDCSTKHVGVKSKQNSHSRSQTNWWQVDVETPAGDKIFMINYMDLFDRKLYILLTILVFQSESVRINYGSIQNNYQRYMAYNFVQNLERNIKLML